MIKPYIDTMSIRIKLSMMNKNARIRDKNNNMSIIMSKMRNKMSKILENVTIVSWI